MDEEEEERYRMNASTAFAAGESERNGLMAFDAASGLEGLRARWERAT